MELALAEGVVQKLDQPGNVFTVEAVTKEFGQKTAEALTETDVLRYHKSLRERGLSDRAASNSYIMLVTLLRFCRVDVNSLLPRETRKKLSR